MNKVESLSACHMKYSISSVQESQNPRISSMLWEGGRKGTNVIASLADIFQIVFRCDINMDIILAYLLREFGEDSGAKRHSMSFRMVYCNAVY